ncbi:MAG: Rieske 2Fe-2S domain-containing protein [Gemmataceae bacterium]|nr:Rieske 2Fe-2S domain-containing protein [Gemmataceae bacterium]
MERRTFLRWAVHGLGAVFAAVVGVPAAVYLIDPRNRPASERGYRRLDVRYSDLTLNQPREVAIREDVRDAWTLQPDEVVGRIWLVRRENDAQGDPHVDAFSATCPHLGCSINYTGSDEFLCPCHGGRFTLTGTRVPPLDSNPAPRNMDNLEDPPPGERNPKLVRIQGTPGNAPDYWIEVRFRKFKTNQPVKEDLT